MTEPSTAPNPQSATITVQAGGAPAKAAGQEKQSRAPRQSRLARLAPLGPTITAVALLVLIGELMLWQAPRPVAVAVNVVAAVVLFIVWVVRRRRAGRGGAGGRAARGGRVAGARPPLSGALGGLPGVAGGAAPSTGQPGAAASRTARGGVLGRLTGGRFGTAGGGSRPAGPRRKATGKPGGSAAAPGASGGAAPSRKGGRLAGLAARLSPGRKAAQPKGGPSGKARKGGSTAGKGRTPAAGASSRGRGLRGRLAAVRRGRAAEGSTPSDKAGAKTSTSSGKTGDKTSKRSGWAAARGGLKAFRHGFRQGVAGRAKDATPVEPEPVGPVEPAPKTDTGRRGPAGGRHHTNTHKGSSTMNKSKIVDAVRRSAGGHAAGDHGPRVHDDQSLFSFGAGLKRAPEMFEEYAKTVEAWARSADEDQPMTQVVVDQMKAAAAMLRKMSADASDWHGSYQRNHDADLARLETPRRGSLNVEQKADVRAARNDL